MAAALGIRPLGLQALVRSGYEKIKSSVPELGPPAGLNGLNMPRLSMSLHVLRPSGLDRVYGNDSNPTKLNPKPETQIYVRELSQCAGARAKSVILPSMPNIAQHWILGNLLLGLSYSD